MRLAEKLLYGVLVWLAIALLGYGIALRQAADSELQNRATTLRQVTTDLSNPGPGNVIKDGRITWSDLAGSTPSGGVKFKLSGSDDTYEMTEASLAATGRVNEVARYLHPGALVRIIARSQDLHVVQFVSNFGTVYQKNLLTPSDMARGEDLELHSAEGRGLGFIAVGILLLPLFFGGRFAWRYYRAQA